MSQTSCGSTSTRSRASPSTSVRAAAAELARLLDELGIVGYPKTTGNRGLHVYVRLEPRWDSYQVRAAAVAAARELERRSPELITAAWWKEERGRRVFVDFNQNAPHKTVFGAWSVRARAGAQVSAPLTWDEVDALHPDELTIATVPARLAANGDPWEGMNERPQSLEPLLELNERDRAAGLMDAPGRPSTRSSRTSRLGSRRAGLERTSRDEEWGAATRGAPLVPARTIRPRSRVTSSPSGVSPLSSQNMIPPSFFLRT